MKTREELILENLILKCEKNEDNKMFILGLKVALNAIKS